MTEQESSPALQTQVKSHEEELSYHSAFENVKANKQLLLVAKESNVVLF